MAKEKSLLEEAIAEAKRVREAAIADATKRLEEHLTPSIKEMLASKLEEELDLDENEEEPLDENSNSGFKEVKLKEAEEEDKPEDEGDDDSAEGDAADADAAADDADAAAADADAAADDADAAADDAAEGDPAAEEENDDDTPLKDITLGDLRTLIQDIVAAGQAPAEGGDLGADMDAGDVEGMGDEMPAGDLGADAAPEGEIPAAGEAAPEDDPAADPTAEDDDEEIDISEILRELEEEEKGEKCPECGKDKDHCICKENKANNIMPEDQTGKEHCKPVGPGKDQDEEFKNLQKENKELKEGLAKMTRTLKDVNLLNSKLLYTTRILNRGGLTESQKVKALKSLDEAKTPKEVKLVYNTLSEGFKKSSPVLKEGRQTSRASRAAGKSTAAPKEILTESNDMVRRFQQLAGIIKD